MIKYPLAVTIDTNIFDAAKYDFSEKSTLSLLVDFVKRGNVCLDNGEADRKHGRFSSGNTLSGKIQCCECGRNYRRIKTRKGEIIWRCAGQVERTSGCQSRTIKQSEIDEYTRSILQIYKETIDTKSLIEKIVVDKNAFKIIVDSTVLS